MVDTPREEVPLLPPPPHPTVTTVTNPIVPFSPTPSVAALVKPGLQTTELKFSAITFALLQALAGAWLSLIGSNSLHVPDWATWIVPAITTLASAYLAGNYTNNRTAVKAAAASSAAGPRQF